MAGQGSKEITLANQDNIRKPENHHHPLDWNQDQLYNRPTQTRLDNDSDYQKFD